MTAMRSFSATFQHLDQLLLAGLSDAELVGRFVERRDEAAFAALVRRYGAVVFGVCRRVLRHEQDAEDAFQATFLVLARNAASVRRAGAVGNWLYGVACNVARKAKAMRQRREAKEREAAARQQPATRAGAPDDLPEVLDGELHALPDKYRTAIVLCDLRGLTIREAAAEVGCPPKTLGTRLSRGRCLLAGRLTRRGVAVAAGALTAALAPCAAAAVPARLIGSTVQTVFGSAAGAAAAISPAVAVLTKGVSYVMLPKTLTVAALACGALALVGISAGLMRAAHGPSKSDGAAHAAPAPADRPADQDAPAEDMHARHARFIGQVHSLLGFTPARGAPGPNAAAADDDKDKPAPSGVWVKKEGELKIDFSAKEVLKIFPHGENEVLIVVCKYTIARDGRVKATITELEGEGKEKAKELLMVGREFSFKWKVQDDAATLGDLTGDNAAILKSHLEGDYGPKK